MQKYILLIWYFYSKTTLKNNKGGYF